MRYAFSFFIGLVLVFFSVLPAWAHTVGQPPFFKVNGTYSALYPVLAMFPDIELPQDIAPTNYLINEPIAFELDTQQLGKVVPAEIIAATNFTWDFGDGTNTEGLKQTHTYAKMGSYVLKINAAYTENGQSVGPTLIQSVLLQILPDEKYQLPRAIIKVNGKMEEEDPSRNVFDLNLAQAITFDASESRAPSSKIASYLWSFADGTESKSVTAKHTFTQSPSFVNPALRVTDANGFFTDAYVGIKNNPKKVNVMYSETKPKGDKQKYLFYTAIFLVALLVAGLLARLFKRS